MIDLVDAPAWQQHVRAYLNAMISCGVLPGLDRWHNSPPASYDSLLPAGMHLRTRPALRHAAVESFPGSETRAMLWAAASRILGVLERLALAEEVWVGGSFLTSKRDPADLDLVIVASTERALTVHGLEAVELEDALDEAKGQHLDIALVLDTDAILKATLQGWLAFDPDRRTPRGIAVLRPGTGR